MKSTTMIAAGALALIFATVGFQNPLAHEQPVAVPDRGVTPISISRGATTAFASEAPVAVAASELPAPAADPVSPDPLRIALQAGHWKAVEAPDELAGLRSNGTRGGGKAEWEVTLEIALLAAALLEEAGYVVDVLPTTVPPGYRADLFIAIHADGHSSSSAHGFTVGAPRRDQTGRAQEFVGLLEQTYREATNLRRREVTRRMQGYYAFNSRRYVHALDPTTVGVIIETGFLTNPGDRNVIVNAPERSALGIAEAVTRFLPPTPSSPPPAVVAR